MEEKPDCENGATKARRIPWRIKKKLE